MIYEVSYNQYLRWRLVIVKDEDSQLAGAELTPEEIAKICHVLNIIMSEETQYPDLKQKLCRE